MRVVVLAQVVTGVRVLARLVRTAGGERIVAVERAPGCEDAVSAIVPVLNERGRLGPCLDGLLRQGPELREIVVVDGGSDDGTGLLVAAYRARDTRVRLLDAGPVPDDWNGKAWGLEIGARHASAGSSWLLTIDADVRPRPGLIASLLTHVCRTGVKVLSAATAQEVAGAGVALVHPALLATLVYRFGIPGHATRRISAVQANGQCMLIRRDLLAGVGGFAAVRASRCEDVTLARLLAADGNAVGFYESDGLVSVRMYESGRETFVNWARSLPLRDRLANRRALIGLAEVTLAQALPLPIGIFLLIRSSWPDARASAHGRAGAGVRGLYRPRSTVAHLLTLNLALLAVRLGILVGTARAYDRRPWTYWLSPLLDVPVVVQLWRSAVAREQRWRGRTLVRESAA